MHFIWKKPALWIRAGCVCIAFGLLACGDNGYSIAVTLPVSVRERVDRIRVRVLLACKTDAVVSNKEISFAKGDDNPPNIGNLKPGTYGIEVTAYDVNGNQMCEIAEACLARQLDAGGSTSIPIALVTQDNPTCVELDGGIDVEPDASVVDSGRCRPRLELCNMLDDDCDEDIDETYDTRTDRRNCGTCGNVCGSGSRCANGECRFTDDSAVVQIATSAEHTCALRQGGTVSCWGANTLGQLGNGTTAEKLTPHPVAQITDATEIGSGRYHTCALRETGQVMCWGDNGWAQLAMAGGGSRSSPVNIPGVTGVRSLAMGFFHACVVTNNGGMMGWGWNGTSQLGRPYGGDADILETPVSIPGVSNVVEADGGFSFTCARHTNGTVSCWGSNDFGQLGDGTVNYRATPGLVKTSSGATLQDATALAVGPYHACVLREGTIADRGTVLCWGQNTYATIGDGTLNHASYPVATNITDAVEIGTGNPFTCARRVGGRVSCWGYNDWGQLGDGTQQMRLTPTAMPNLTDAAALATDSGDVHNCAIRMNGDTVCWGSNFFGQLGIGTKSNVPSVTPVPVQGL